MLRRWELGNALRANRTRLNLTGEDVAKAVHDAFAGSFSPAKLSRIESGQQAPSTRDVSDLAHVYGLGKDEREQLIEMARKAKQPGWWQQYRAIEAKYSTYTDLESAAASMRNYESTFVPGLLQTADYAKAVIDGLNPEYGDAHRKQLLDVRLRRQERLRGEDPLQFHAVIQENALRRTIGTKQVMLDQIRHLQAMAELPNVTLQIIRYNAGLYVALQASSFVLLDFAEAAALPTVAYVEGILWNNLFAEDDAQAQRFADAFAEMADLVALPAADTPDFLVDVHDRVSRSSPPERG
jgi:transcriptional regulator with XRE-family HTH domain